MVYGNPVNPVSGTVITVAYAVTNILDPIRWLRLMTGNTDPPGTSYLVASTSVSGTQWQKVTTDLIADGAVTAPKFAYVPVNKAGDSGIGSLYLAGSSLLTLGGGSELTDTTVFRLRAHGNTFVVERQDGTQQILNASTTQFLWLGNTVIHSGNIGSQSVLNAVNATNAPSGLTLANGGVLADATTGTFLRAHNNTLVVANEANTLQMLNVTPSQFLYLGQQVIHSGNIGSQSVLNAVNASHAPGGLLLANGGQLADVPTGTILGANSDTFVVQTESGSAQILNVTPSQFLYNGIKVWTELSDGSGSGLDADTVDGQHASAFATTAALAAVAAVPSGLIAAVASSSIPTGWTRYSAADGRLLIGDGVSLGVTWTLGNNIGTSWSHDHGTSGVTAASTFTGTGATIPASASTNQANVTTPATAFSLGGHTHSYTPAGSVSTTLSGNVNDTSWQPAMRVIQWIIKT